MPDDIVTQVEKLSRAVDRTVYRVEALRIGVIGLLSALARHDPVLAAKIMSDVIRVLDAAADVSELQARKTELDELGQDLRRELRAVLEHAPPDGRLL